jgi:hypothetical protein
MDRHNGPAGKSEADSGSAVCVEAWWVGQPVELPGWAEAKQSPVVDPDGWWVDHPGLTPHAVPAAVPVPAARRPRLWRPAVTLLLVLALGLAAAVTGWRLGTGEARPERTGAVEPAAPESLALPSGPEPEVAAPPPAPQDSPEPA